MSYKQCNCTGRYPSSVLCVRNFKEILAKHIVSPVRFDKAIQLMKAEGIKRFIEIGPGKTLTGFIKKDYPEAELYNINNLETLEKIGEK